MGNNVNGLVISTLFCGQNVVEYGIYLFLV